MNSVILLNFAYAISALAFISTMVWFIVENVQQKDNISEGTFLGFFMGLGFTGFFTLGFGILASDIFSNSGEPMPLGVIVSIISFVLLAGLSFYALHRKKMNFNNNELFKKKNVKQTSYNKDALNANLTNRLNLKSHNKTNEEQAKARI
jgi:ABC-type transport system involved in multi-copper enzyme maturation permease subunit